MDGVPGVTFKGIDPGETFVYRFPVKQYGPYWYHSHSGGQEQLGLYGPFVIDPADAEPFTYAREHVVILSDWTFSDPMRLLAKLKKQSNFSNLQQRTLGDFFDDVSAKGLKRTWADRKERGKMRMDQTDIADLTGTYFDFPLDGRPAAAPWTGIFKPGERVRLRIINSAAMTHFDVCIPGLKMTVVQADGQHVKPVEVDEFRMGAAETYDVIVEPKEDRAYARFAETTDRSGFALGTLAPREGMRPQIPERRIRPLRLERSGGSTAVAFHGSANDTSFHRNRGFRDLHSSFRMRCHTLVSKSGSGLGVTIQQASSFWRELRVFMANIVSVRSPSISSHRAFHRGGSCSVLRSRTGPERAETAGCKAGSIAGTDVHHDRGG